MAIRRVLRNATQAALWPVSIAILLALFVLTYRLIGGPSPDELIELAFEILKSPALVVAAAFLEGLLVVNLYFPGSLIILVGMTQVAGRFGEAVALVLCVCTGFQLASTLNYLIGRHGWYRFFERVGSRRAMERAGWLLQRHGGKLLILAQIHPNLGAFVATNCGIANFSFVTFFVLAAVGTFAWSAAWGALFYHIPVPAKAVAGDLRIVFAALAVWAVAAILSQRVERRREQEPDRDVSSL